jgi:YHS domain-containing protein
MVEDPVVHVRFPKEAAGATLEVHGKTYYFVGEETRRKFEKKQGLTKGQTAKPEEKRQETKPERKEAQKRR